MRYISILILLLSSGAISFAQTVPKGITVNQDAPDFSAKDQNGRIVSLKGQIKKGPVVLVFYRGQWCPYCNRQLKNLEDSLPYITARGATLIAVTPESPENVSKTIQKTKASYPILHDEGLRIMNSYDVAFEVDNSTVKRYLTIGIDLEKANGSNGASLPVPAVFVISREGKILYRHFDPDYKRRPSIVQILAYL